MKTFIKAFAVVGTAAIIGYEIGVRKWEEYLVKSAIDRAVFINTELAHFREWINTAGQTLSKEDFCQQLEERLQIIESLSDRN